MDVYKESLELHETLRGKLEVHSKIHIKTHKDLSLVYTPGVAEPCRAIARHKADVYKYTIKGNTIAVISDGSSVLGLGNIGAEAGIPVMEGKAALFKELANIDAFPICLASQDQQRTIETIRNISPIFGGINLEDIKAPQCFEIEAALQDLGIPVMHDDQHATSVVVLAGLTNALNVVGKDFSSVKIVVNGAGAAATATTKLLLHHRVKAENVILVDTHGIIYNGREDLVNNNHKQELALLTNSAHKRGRLADAMKNADVFLGMSVGNVVSKEMVRSMSKNAIVFAMANPEPEIMPTDAYDAGAAIVATGRSDFPNQVNNVLAYPGIFRGALDARVNRITEEMKVAAALALAAIVKNPTTKNLLPYPTDRNIVPAVSKAVQMAWKRIIEKGSKK